MTAEDLWLEVIAYRQWIIDNPVITTKVVKDSEGNVMLFEHPKPRAMSTMGFCVFAAITQGDWEIFRKRASLTEMVELAEGLFRSHVFEGAAVDLFNPTFIAKHLGLAERRELTGADGKPLFEGEMTEEEFRKKATERGIPTDLFD